MKLLLKEINIPKHMPHINITHHTIDIIRHGEEGSIRYILEIDNDKDEGVISELLNLINQSINT